VNLTNRKKNSAKRKIPEPRDIVPKDELLHGRNLVFRVALAAVLIFGITFLYPIDKVYLPIEIPQVGEVASKDLIAPFDFPIMKTDEELARDRNLVLRNLRPVVTFDSSGAAAIKEEADAFFKKTDSLMSTDLSREDVFNTLRSEYKFPRETSFEILADRAAYRKIREFSLSIIDTILTAGLISDLEDLPFEESGLVTVDSGEGSKTVSREQIFDSTGAATHVNLKASAAIPDLPEARRTAVAIVLHFLKPDMRFERELTAKNRNAELEAITPYKGWVYKGENIIKANERVTEDHRDKLLSLAHYKRLEYSKRSFWQFILPPLGRLFLVAFPILFFGFYLYYFRRQAFASNSALMLFGILLASVVIILYMVVSQKFLSPYLVPITIASMLVTIAFDIETGLFLTVSASFLVGVLSGFRLDVAFVGLAAGTVAAFSVRNVRHRHEFYRSIIYLTVVYFGIVYIIESLKLAPIADLWRHSGLAVLNGFLSPILTIGLLPLFESTFGLTTDITLLEFSDLNRPLLKRLALEAPGTYHHSIMIGTLAEEAAEAINANSLLARVGSYYHDIGKMLKPEYFVENQMGAKNKHEKLAPSMSALILEAHVKEGKELAEAHGLPQCLIEFITGHHGSSVMSYFYEKAKSTESDEVNVDEYRYPGPKPVSKEVAIVMLADSVEAASRTLEDPTPARIRGLVRKIIFSRFESGQLDDCDLTLRDLSKIEDSFVRVLIGIFHRRIAYPEKEPEEVSPG
jgi:putative nucleotidyltransferase with HDIG domain